jgi:hypothetical protein
MVLRLTSRSPRRPDFVVTVVSRIKVLSAPGRADLPPQNLTPALGRQNHTTSPSASPPFVCAPFDRSRAQHPPCDHLVRAGLPRPPHPIPNVRDDRETPLCGPGRFGYASDCGEAKYFCKWGWTSHFGKHEVICPSGTISLIRFKQIQISRKRRHAAARPRQRCIEAMVPGSIGYNATSPPRGTRRLHLAGLRHSKSEYFPANT